jgi:serine phosphatase RsbU (regulator of sigma subunit)
MVVSDARTDEMFRDIPTVASGEIASYAGYPLLGPGGERVGALCVFGAESRDFTPTDLRLLHDLAQWVQDELTAEAELARGVQVQQGLLPAPLVSLAGYQVAGASRPVRSISGDFYDWYPAVGGAAFTFGGVMAKSVVAALIAATVRATMRASSRTDGAAAAVENAADTLDADLDGAGVFVTLFHGHLDERSGLLHYVDAGHGLTIVVHADGSAERLDPTGPPLGAGWENTWEERTIHLSPGDILLSVSDGVLDAFGGTLDALAKVGALARGATSAEQVVTAVVAAAGDPADDVTVMAVRRDDVIRVGR